MVEQRDVPVALPAAGGVVSAEGRLGRVTAIREYRLQCGAPVAALALHQSRRAVNADVGQRRLGAHVDTVAGGVGGEHESHALEADQQRVGSDVVGLERLAVEAADRAAAARKAAIDDEVAAIVGAP
jgi:hypothetical protein